LEEDISRFAGGAGFSGRKSSWRITGDKVTVWIGIGSRLVRQMEVGRLLLCSREFVVYMRANARFNKIRASYSQGD
jgi:hypothetical protein